MYMHLRQLTTLVLTCSASMVLFSCQSSRMSGGFTYAGSKHAPDMGSSGSSIPAIETPAAAFAPVTTLDQAIALAPAEKQEQAHAIAQAIKEEMAAEAQSGKTISRREALHVVTEKLVKTGQIAPVSPHNMKKMDKIARKMDLKAQSQGPDLDMRNISGLEWFYLIMAAAGLVLGIIGLALGWVVFLVFGGLFLYWKLVRDK